MNNQDYHVRHGQTFLTLQESLLTNFQLIRKDIADPPRIQGYPSSKPSVSGSYLSEVFKTFERAGNSDIDFGYIIFVFCIYSQQIP